MQGYQIEKNYENHREILREEFEKNIRALDTSRNQYVPYDNVVLEIGAGANNAREWFKDKGYIQYTGVDNGSEYMQDGIKKMDAHDMREFAGESFDIVYLSHTAEHFLNPVRAFQEINRVLKRGGKVVSITPYPCQHQILHGDGSHYSVLSNQQWIRVLISAGFSPNQAISYVQMTCKGKQIPLEQDWQVITVAIK